MGVEPTTEQQSISTRENAADSPPSVDGGKRVFVEKRPTAVSVVGWTWIVVGGLAVLGAASNLQLMLVTDDSSVFGSWLTVGVVVQGVVGAVGLYAGIRFLRLDGRARQVLEYLTWALAALLVASFVAAVVSMGLDSEDGLGFVLVIGLMLALYGVPVFFMLKALRSQRVKDAMQLLPNKRINPSASR